MEESVLYSDTIEYTYDELKKYVYAKHGQKGSLFPKSSIVFICLAVLCFSIHQTGSAIAFLLLSGLQVAFLFLTWQIKIKRTYKANKRIWDREVTIRLYEAYAEIESEEESKHFDYDEFYRVIDSNERLYLIASPRDILIIDKEKCKSELIDAILEAVQ